MGETIFADCMLETSWVHRSRRSWTTLSSFGVQAIAIGLLLLLPLLRSAGVPLVRKTVSVPVSAWGPGPQPSRAGPQPPRAPWTQIVSAPARFVAPGEIPHTIATTDGGMTGQEFLETCTIGCGASLPGGTGVTGFPIPLGGTRPVMPAVAAKPVRTFRTSYMLEGSLIRRVPPTYPPLARNARVQGSVVLFAMISRAGVIENLRVVRGHPLLVGAAIDAVRQWRYRPYILNGEPIEVETEITVNFVLGN
jgi:periplasmic protein TonB